MYVANGKKIVLMFLSLKWLASLIIFLVYVENFMNYGMNQLRHPVTQKCYFFT